MIRLLRRVLPSQDFDALLGDITEESRRRSRVWYAAQIVAVVVVGSWRDIRRHPLLALRAVGIGVAAFIALLWFMLGMGLGHVLELTNTVENAWFRSIDPMRLRKFDTAFYFAWSALLFYLALAGSGWIVGRVNRKHGIALVLPFATLAALVLRPTYWHGDHLVLSGLWFEIAKSLAAPLSVLVGGYFATRRVDLA